MYTDGFTSYSTFSSSSKKDFRFQCQKFSKKSFDKHLPGPGITRHRLQGALLPILDFFLVWSDCKDIFGFSKNFKNQKFFRRLFAGRVGSCLGGQKNWDTVTTENIKHVTSFFQKVPNHWNAKMGCSDNFGRFRLFSQRLRLKQSNFSVAKSLMKTNQK